MYRFLNLVSMTSVLLLAFGAAGAHAAALVSDHDIGAILLARCATCHSAHPAMMASAPKGLTFASPAEIDRHAHAIYRQVVELRAMPLGNVTNMTDAERRTIALWFNERSNSHPVKGEGVRPH
ncbi:hypothetical protein [Paraburkholderia tropica]|uniref:hypothetical protein n=1 Tax=Paraburkholderia tropica TaxID=92647 RepID=UPI001F1EE38E|nr:hypothetical protein [Paraburkholderia tropica]